MSSWPAVSGLLLLGASPLCSASSDHCGKGRYELYPEEGTAKQPDAADGASRRRRGRLGGDASCAFAHRRAADPRVMHTKGSWEVGAHVKSRIAAVGVGFIAGVTVAPFSSLAGLMIYGRGIAGARATSELVKMTGEVAGWALGSFVGAWLAAKLRPRLSLLAAGGLGFAFFVVDGLYFVPMSMPNWFWLAGAAACLLCGVMGAELGNGSALEQADGADEPQL
jgi:hypothetical protein